MSEATANLEHTILVSCAREVRSVRDAADES
jgi:hypothetical protein